MTAKGDRGGGGQRYVALDSLRGIAACLVVIFHMPSDGRMWGTAFVQHGFLAVTFFFVLSGFVIGATYGERLGTGFPVRRFMLLRLGRIYPLHLFAIAVIFAWEILRLITGWPAFREGAAFTGNTDLGQLPYNILLLQKFAPYVNWNRPSWSIGIEWWTYLIFAVTIAGLGFRRKLYPTAALLIVPAIIARLLRIDPESGVGATIDCMMNFGLGLIVYQLHTAFRGGRHDARLGRGVATVLEAATMILAVWLVSAFGGRLSPAIAPAFALVVAVFSLERGLVSRLLVVRPMLLLGELSYSIYMIHQFILDRGFDLLGLAASGGSPLPRPHMEGRIVLTGDPVACDLYILAMLLIVIALSWFSYRVIETPARLWSRRLVNHGRSAKVTPPDPTAAF
ncbi:acyltransferase family protein [Sphingomonas bacterium]|uniref:acyltransferase family protein n=1 Tax=Sphingomonas bacterium TaxID=1895847 RepID=UPI0015766312|nr:acyltransferase [Sphingomonas bacterium]